MLRVSVNSLGNPWSVLRKKRKVTVGRTIRKGRC